MNYPIIKNCRCPLFCMLAISKTLARCMVCGAEWNPTTWTKITLKKFILMRQTPEQAEQALDRCEMNYNNGSN